LNHADLPTGVVAIDTPQNVIWQEEAVNIPASLAGRMRRILEILVVSFQETKIRAIHLGFGHEVGAEQNAVGIFKKKIACRIRLTA